MYSSITISFEGLLFRFSSRMVPLIPHNLDICLQVFISSNSFFANQRALVMIIISRITIDDYSPQRQQKVHNLQCCLIFFFHQARSALSVTFNLPTQGAVHQGHFGPSIRWVQSRGRDARSLHSPCTFADPHTTIINLKVPGSSFACRLTHTQTHTH